MAAKTSSNGTKPATTTDIKNDVVAINDVSVEPTKPDTLDNDNAEFIDYLDSKTIESCMIELSGKRIEHGNAKLGVCAVGRVRLRIDGKIFDYGIVKKEAVTLSQTALSLPYKTGDVISNADLLGVKLEVEKMWCYGVKKQLLASKTEKESEKQAARKAKRQALSKLI